MRSRLRCFTILAKVLAVILSTGFLQAQRGSETDWPNYGNDPGGTRYSPLAQINRDNVSQLKIAWTVHTGDISDGGHGRRRSGFEATPIFINETLYFSTGFNRVIVLDPETGKQKWAYDPKVDLTLEYGDGLVNRGVSTWLDSKSQINQPCH